MTFHLHGAILTNDEDDRHTPGRGDYERNDVDTQKHRDRKWENFDYDGFERLSEALRRREEQRKLNEALNHRTFNGYERKVKQIGKKDEIDKEWDRKLFEHREEIAQFYKDHPELGRPKND